MVGYNKNCHSSEIMAKHEKHLKKKTIEVKAYSVCDGSLVSRLSSFCHGMLQVGCFYTKYYATTSSHQK